jgi:mono/diheme cytochrome c family protein
MVRPTLSGTLFAALVLAIAGAVGGVIFLKVTGLSARATPSRFEAAAAKAIRAMAIPREYASRTNPVPRDDASIRSGMEHFADHCATCHANDGSGTTAMGKGLFPPAPDMRLAATQDLSDGELFYIIEHGVRFTGMPAWGTGTREGEEASWHLVNFIRHLPRLTPSELEAMAELNPRPPAEVRRQIEEQRFLEGHVH